MKTFLKHLKTILSLFCFLIGSIFLFIIFTPSKEQDKAVSIPQIIETPTQEIPIEVIQALRSLKTRLEDDSGKVTQKDIYAALKQVAQQSHAAREPLLRKILERSEKLNERVEERGKQLSESDNAFEQLLGVIQEKLKQANLQNEKWKVLSNDIKAMNRTLERHNTLEAPEQILRTAISLLTSNGGQLLYRPYRWAYIAQIVDTKDNGKLYPGITGMYEIESGKFTWVKPQKYAYPDPYDVQSIPGAYRLFSEEDVRGINPGSPYTHIRVVGDILLSISTEHIAIKHDEHNPRLLTITFPAPSISSIRFVWDGTQHGISLIERASPYNLVPFVTSNQQAWEDKLKKAFLMDLTTQNAINPEEFVRGIANLLTPIFEERGYAVTFFFGDTKLSSLVQRYMKISN